ncbi:MAG: hypothetical protein JWR80_7495 [Bradyrhizobium sp.]|nr:hypothetical protein [Bradyrhizobium sp.]
MRQSLACFATDGVNLDNMLLPLSELVAYVERHVALCGRRGLPIGLPLNISHDWCRPAGWSRSTGVHLAKDKGRQIGTIFEPITAEEREEIIALAHSFWRHDQVDRVSPHADDLRARIAGATTLDVKLGAVGAAVASAPGLGADLYPEFFVAGSAFVDKDGLVDYAVLLERTEQLFPGIFHEPVRDLILFAHPFFRRSLSRMNSLNPYALESFHHAATTSTGVRGRLRLDPDLVGHPDSARATMEMEYWRGPHFDENIAKIAAGVAEHKANSRDRYFSGVDKTQIWWKNPEERRHPDTGAYQVRTFEIEELIEDPSAGLGSDHYGCRYAHAEYDLANGVISHFDGAIRAYGGDAYLDRLDLAIDRAGKRSDYTKLFRLDGQVPVSNWKRLLTDFYRGNKLVPEYLGAPGAREDRASRSQLDESEEGEGTEDEGRSGPDDEAEVESSIPVLSALVNFDIEPHAPVIRSRHLMADQVLQREEENIAVAEVGRGALAELLRQWTDPETIPTFGVEQPIANIATIFLGEGGSLDAEWAEVAASLADAMASEVGAGRLAGTSVGIRWRARDIVTTLSIAGDAALVARMLRNAVTVVRPEQLAAEWIEPFNDILRRDAPDLTAPVHWPPSAVTSGRLVYPRGGEVLFTMTLPDPRHPGLSDLKSEA